VLVDQRWFQSGCVFEITAIPWQERAQRNELRRNKGEQEVKR